MTLSRVISEIFNVEKSKNVVTLKLGVKGHSTSLRVVSFDRLCMVSYIVFFSKFVPKRHRF